MRLLAASLRRPGSLVGTFVALVAAAVIVIWTISLAATGSRSPVPPQRVAHGRRGHGPLDCRRHLGHRGPCRRRPSACPPTAGSGLGRRAAGHPPRRSGGRPGGLDATGPGLGRRACRHRIGGAASHRLRLVQRRPTSFRLESGHAPTGSANSCWGPVGSRLRGGRRPGAVGRSGPVPFEVVGIVTPPSGNPAGDGAVFLSEAEAGSLAGHPVRRPIGVTADPASRRRSSPPAFGPPSDKGPAPLPAEPSPCCRVRTGAGPRTSTPRTTCRACSSCRSGPGSRSP